MKFMTMDLLWQLFCCKISFLVKVNIVLDIMAINKALYKAMYGNTGGIIEGQDAYLFLWEQNTAYSKM